MATAKTIPSAEPIREQRFSPEEAASFDLLDILVILSRRRSWILMCACCFGIVGIALALLLRPNFTATAMILPPEQRTSSAALLSQLSPLSAFGGVGASALGLKSPADMYIGFLESRTIADELIHRYGLQQVYNQRTVQDARRSLRAHSNFESGKDGLIHISVTDHDPQRASDLANGYVQTLHALNSNLAVTEASQRREFFDQQLDEERKALASAEDQLREVQQKTGLIQLNSQAEILLRSIADLRAQIASRQVELQSYRAGATDENPNVVRLHSEIATMQGQLSKLENDQQRNAQSGGIASSAGSVPKDSLEYLRKMREVKYHDTLLDLLSRQAEAARIDQAKAAPVIQIVDNAIAPDKRSGPPRIAIILGFLLLGIAIGCMAALQEYAFDRLHRIPRQAAKLRNLRSQFRKAV